MTGAPSGAAAHDRAVLAGTGTTAAPYRLPHLLSNRQPCCAGAGRSCSGARPTHTATRDGHPVAEQRWSPSAAGQVGPTFCHREGYQAGAGPRSSHFSVSQAGPAAHRTPARALER